MKLHSFLKKNPLKSRTWSFFAAVLFMCCAYVPQAHAQLYTSYKNLFDGTDPSAKLKVQYPLFVSTGTGQALTPALKFNFQGSFTWKEENDKKQHWDHIVDFDNKYAFVLRICDANATGEGSCLFSKVPYKSNPFEDKSLFCPGGQCKIPDYKTEAFPKIYHYAAIIGTVFGNTTLIENTTIQNDKFHVLFDVSELAFLKNTVGSTGDGLDTPIPAKDLFKIGDKTVYKADIWYCAQPYGGEALPSDDVATEPGIRQFNKLCGDGTHAYFKIAESGTFTMPASATEALGQTASTVDQVDTTPTDTDSAGDNLPVCSILNGALGTSGTFMGCVAQAGYYILYYPAAWIAGIFGKIFDFFLGYSISDESYRAPVVETGWKLVRDISNIFFIIILVWTGLSAVFNIQKLSMRSVVPALIINALIINFSLFGTRLVIDISNVTARLFYNTMSICEGDCRYQADPTTGKMVLQNPSKDTIGGFKPLSSAIVSSFNPQNIFKPEVLSPSNATPGVKAKDSDNNIDRATGQFNAQGVNSSLNAGKKLGVYDSAYAGYFLIVSLIAAFIMLAIAKMFFSVMFIFIGRVVGLYVAMIFSPFAVLTRGDLPIVSKFKTLSWDSWKKEVGQYVALAPLFVFFLYIIYAFINSDFVKNLKLGSDTDFMGTVLSIAIPMVIIYTLVSYGAKLAKDYAGKFGEMVQGFGNKATSFVGGAAVGIATGGAALAGRNILGRLGTRMAASNTLQNVSSRGGFTGRLADRALRIGGNLSRSTYDARNVSAINRQLTRIGPVNTRIGNILGTNQSSTAGGYQGAVTRRVTRQNDRANRMLLTEDQIVAQDARNTAWENTYQNARNTAQQAAIQQGQVFDENAFRTTYVNTQATAGNVRPESAAEINRRREQNNQARLARRTVLQRVAQRATNRVTTPTGAAGVTAAVAGAPITGAIATAAAAIVGQGAIQNTADARAARGRAANARNPVTPAQRTRLEAEMTRLQTELQRVIRVMNTIAGSPIFANRVPPVTYQNLSNAEIIDYRNDRQNVNNTLQQQIDAEDNFINQHKNNPAMSAQVQQARRTIQQHRAQMQQNSREIQEAQTILGAYQRVQNDIDNNRRQQGI